MLLDIEHKLSFAYDGYVSESWMELRVEPRTTANQTLETFYLAVGPPTKVFRYPDGDGNVVHHFSVADYHDAIEVVTRSLVETRPPKVIPIMATEPVPTRAVLGAKVEFAMFGGPVKDSASLRELSASLPQGGTLGERIVAIGQGTNAALGYKAGATHVRSTSDDALQVGFGVCQDYAHLMLGLLRLEGIPGRYVNGYLHVEDQTPERPSESHAWVEAWSPQHGWIGYDPTQGVWPTERHVAVATGRSYDDVPPNRGVYRGMGEETLKAMVVTTVTDRGARSGLRDEMGQIPLPVFAERPITAARPVPALDLGADQQQQQQ